VLRTRDGQMHADSLRERLSQVLDGWDYDFSKFVVSDFIAWVESRRGRPILTRAMRLPPNLFGAWFEGDKADHIFYEAEPPDVHTVHNILHELSHLLLGHRTVHISSDLSEHLRAGAELDQSETQPVVNGLFRSIQYADEQEVEAETLSSLIQQRVFYEAGLAALTHISHDAAMQQFVHDMGFNH
jgi:hypothetical protein